MSPLQAQLDRVRRRRTLVIAVMLIALAGAVGYSLLSGTSYTGRAALTVASDRSPEQDVPLAQGYVEYFNQEFAQDALAEAAGVPSGVSFSARNSATSPIIYIEATASSAEVATEAARNLAGAFRDEINAGVRQQAEQPIADLRAQIDQLQAEVDAGADSGGFLGQQISSIQDRIIQIQADTSGNQLKDLSLNAGVTSSPPNVVQNAVLGLVGGLILGVVLALAFATAEDRLATAGEIRERLDLDTLAVIKRSDGGLRDQQLKSLANVVSLSNMARPAVLAVAAVRSTSLSAEVAESLAYHRARQGERTLLIRADLDPDRARQSHRGRPGLGEFLAGRRGVRLQPFILQSPLNAMLILPAGGVQEDPYTLFAPERIIDAIQQASRLADLIVIDAPPIVEAAESQVICASADRTILVVEEGTTRASDAIEARERLDRVHSVILGAVIGEAETRGRDRAASDAAHADPVASRAPHPEAAGEVDVRA